MAQQVSPPNGNRAIGRPRPRTSEPITTSCQTYTFEGLADGSAIAPFDGISSGWVAAISTADHPSTLFVNPPSPITAAVFLNSSHSTITFANPVESVQFYYASPYTTTLTAYDSNNNVLATQQAPANSTSTPYSVWTQTAALSAASDRIASLSLQSSGPPTNNFLGIDNLKICTSLSIWGVEMTQAIQQIQTLADLETSLAANQQPPVPIVAGKPGVMRVYMNPVPAVTTVDIQLTVPAINFGENKMVSIAPDCAPAKQRFPGTGCPSTDFYFTPPSGAWIAALEVFDSDSGASIEEEVLSFTSIDTQPLVLRGVAVCDTQSLQFWQCAAASDLVGLTSFLEKIAPASSVSLEIPGDVIRRDISLYCPNSAPQNCDQGWWIDTVKDAARIYTAEGAAQDLLQNRHTTYEGMTRDTIAGEVGGVSGNIPGNAVASRENVPRFSSNTETDGEVVAHENGHALGLKHTNSGFPQSPSAPPGCYNFASDPTTDWPWAQSGSGNPGNNYIQSAGGYEVGFDVAGRMPLDPTANFELMSYCSPRWIAPQRYNTMIATLRGSGTPAPSVVTQPFWQVTGTIPSVGSPQFDPLFQLVLQGDASEGSGTYSLVVRDSGGAALFTRLFTPSHPVTETAGTDFQGDAYFSELLPVTPGATQIVLLDPNGAALGSITLGGTAPTVTIVNPTNSFDGTTAISWTVTGASAFTSRVYYSPNNGASWSEIGQVLNSGTSLGADFTTLPGTNGQGLIRVLVSDGVNTGQAVSVNFSITKKMPSIVRIMAPADNSSQPAQDSLLLIGAAYDVDDGVLRGAALSWSSNLQGFLGSGSPLSASLNPGVHIISLTAKDSDGNAITATVTVTVGDQPPNLNVTIVALSAPPSSQSTCIEATVAAAPGSNGAPLSSVQYSTDGGNTYANISLSVLPFSFVIPGTGYIHLIVRATDTSGQSTYPGFGDVAYFNSNPCQPLAVPNVVGLTLPGAGQALAPALVLGNVVSAVSATVPAGKVISQSPAQGTAIPAGSSVAVNLVISTGNQVPVPNVVGFSQAAAANAITAAGLAPGTVTASASDTVPSGDVIAETPAAGTSVNGGTPVSLTVSTGPAPALAIVKSHTGNFARGQMGTYIVAVSNTGGAPTNGTVTVTETVPTGLTLSAMAGVGWTCPNGGKTCTRSDALGGGGSYPTIAVTVNVADGAAASVINRVTASGGGSSPASASDPTMIVGFSACDVNQAGSVTAGDVQTVINEALGVSSGSNDLNHDGAINLVDVQIVIDAALNLGCSGS